MPAFLEHQAYVVAEVIEKVLCGGSKLRMLFALVQFVKVLFCPLLRHFVVFVCIGAGAELGEVVRKLIAGELCM